MVLLDYVVNLSYINVVWGKIEEIIFPELGCYGDINLIIHSAHKQYTKREE